ncbi:BREX-1 system adenine-specific DNA-methyltransferase PglX, partial [Weissella cibaria]|nr:BREX-1 system adenine-specific DNA-methyltransferase PglX [Weissella cibaria]
MIKDVPESDFDVDKSGQVEIIGWLYQYYNEEAKAESMKKSKYTEADIAPVTQLFTPDWIVKYMVENSLGRYWVDHLRAKNDTRSESEIAKEFGWQYYMPAVAQPVEIDNKLIIADAFKADQSIEDIKLLDPAMGSGHILVYA